MSQNLIGRYTIIEEIGRGGMAYVYRGFDPRFKRDVAIKVLTRDLMDDATLIARFEREAQTIAALEHPAIVPVYDFGEDDSRPYLVMRLMTGGTLTDQLKQGPITINKTVKILDRIGSALERAHQKGVVHRDLKPSNIMFDDYGDAFLADFGIARLTESAITLTGDSVIGTPAYMSPEQIHGDKEIDGRSDIYALGVICFEMLTGQRPYIDSTPTKVMMRHIIDPVPDIRAINPDLPQGIDQLITKTMAKEPNDRYATAGEMTATLSTLSRLEPAPPTTEAPLAATSLSEPVETITAEALADTPPVPTPGQLESASEIRTVVETASIDVEPAPAVVSASPETEIMAPTFASQEAPSSEVMVPAGASHPKAEISLPKFAEQQPGPVEKSSARRWIIFGGLGLLLVIFVIAAGAGGVFLLGNRDKATPAVVADQPTDRPTAAVAQAEPTEIRPAEPTPVEDPGPLAEAHMETFYAAMENEDFDLALSSIDQALALMPENPWYYHEKSWLFQTMGDMGAAIEFIHQAIELEPEGSQYYERRGAILREIGDLEGALEDHQRSIQLDPSNAFAHIELALTLREMGELEAAIQEFDQAIELESNESWFFGERAETYYMNNEPLAAIRDFNRAHELDPEDPWYLTGLANTHFWELSDPDTALEFMDQAIALDPESPWRYIDRVSLNREIGNLDALLPDNNRAIELDPEDSWLVLERGITLWYYLDNPEAALDDFNRAIELEADNSNAFRARGDILFHIFDNVDGALADLNRAIELDPDSVETYNLREVLYTRVGDIDAALADIERCLELDPEFFWCNYDRAWIWDDLGDIDAALADFERFLELVPDYECPECQEEVAVYIQNNG
ncbi:MAG TPA: protein kinase [Patescibacteria group bacterium]|nr:protein kinase [Patescibacteria group bacterium]